MARRWNALLMGFPQILRDYPLLTLLVSEAAGHNPWFGVVVAVLVVLMCHLVVRARPLVARFLGHTLMLCDEACKYDDEDVSYSGNIFTAARNPGGKGITFNVIFAVLDYIVDIRGVHGNSVAVHRTNVRMSTGKCIGNYSFRLRIKPDGTWIYVGAKSEGSCVEPSFWFRLTEELDLDTTSRQSMRYKLTLDLFARGPNAASVLNNIVASAVRMLNKDTIEKHQSNSICVFRPGRDLVYSMYDVKPETFATASKYTTSATHKRIDDLKAKIDMGSKLGMLLHGPPGTGKTTFVKLLAVATGRHIVSVDLKMYENRREALERLLLVGELCLDEGDVPVKVRLPLHQCIFLMDEIDGCIITHARKASDDPMIKLSVGDESEGTEHDSFHPRCRRPGGTRRDINRGTKKYGSGSSSSYIRPSDKLTQEALLEMLDGVVPAERRIIIGITNFPELLAPALKRPGRLGDANGEMTFMSCAEVMEIIGGHQQHHDELDRVVRQLVESGPPITIAQLVNAIEMHGTSDLEVLLESLKSMWVDTDVGAEE